MKTLHERLHVNHYFTHPYCPWSNGTVEVVCRELQRVLRALQSELKLPRTEWPRLIPLVTYALNNQKLERLAGRAPLTVFAGLPSHSDMGVYKLKNEKEINFVRPEQVRILQKVKIEKLHAALEYMHRKVAKKYSETRARSNLSHNQKTGVHANNFDKSDFLCCACMFIVSRESCVCVGWDRVW